MKLKDQMAVCIRPAVKLTDSLEGSFFDLSRSDKSGQPRMKRKAGGLQRNVGTAKPNILVAEATIGIYESDSLQSCSSQKKAIALIRTIDQSECLSGRFVDFYNRDMKLQTK